MDAQSRDEFRPWVVVRSPALLRTAYLLTGSRADAENLLQTATAKTFLAWGRNRDREARDGFVQRVMVNHARLLKEGRQTAGRASPPCWAGRPPAAEPGQRLHAAGLPGSP